MRFFLFVLLLIPAITLAVATYSATDSQQMYVSGSDLVSVEPSFPLRAFPEAEGLAALTRGAADIACDGIRSVYTVTNLNDTGAGSLRNGVEGAGKDCRFINFKTSGNINLLTPLIITSSYITISGQTSSGGISTAGNVVQIGQDNDYGYHDILIRHMRFRAGSHGGAADEDEEAFRIWESNNIMIDQCSFSWGADETMSITTYNDASAYNITISRSIISHGLTDPAPESNHGYGLLFNGTYINTPENSMDIHGSYFAHHNNRMPQLSGAGRFSLVNNVIYNFDATQGAILIPYAAWTDGLKVNYVGNYVKRGTDSNLPIGSGGNSAEITAQGGGTQGALNTTPYEMLFMQNNFGVVRTADNDAEWAISNGWSGSLVPETWRSLAEFAVSEGVPITRTTLIAATAEAQATAILANVGATKPYRDSYDTEVINDFINGTGTLQADVTYPTDWPTLTDLAYPTDTDNDGMSDVWETDNGLNVGINDALLDLDNDGYLNIEEYTHYLAGDI